MTMLHCDPERTLYCNPQSLSTIRAFAAPLRCASCGDWMVAPDSSEFVEGGEIRHHWQCDSCGEDSTTSILMASD